MSWFGKMIGGSIGLTIGGPLGAVVGAVIGHNLFDKDSRGPQRRRRVEWDADDGRTGGRSRGTGYSYQRSSATGSGSSSRTSGGTGYGTSSRSSSASGLEQKQAAYFLALFSILGKLAKADGRVTREEGEAVVTFLDRMGVTGDERQFAIRVFNEAKDARYDVSDFARQFAEMTAGQHDLRSSMVDMLFQIAIADNEFHPAEEAIINRVAEILGISASQRDSIRARYIGNAEHAYAVLGLSDAASDDEVRAAYRQLVQEYHPDRIVAQGMPQEFVEYATGRFQEIQTAWDQIKRARNL